MPDKLRAQSNNMEHDAVWQGYFLQARRFASRIAYSIHTSCFIPLHVILLLIWLKGEVLALSYFLPSLSDRTRNIIIAQKPSSSSIRFHRPPCVCLSLYGDALSHLLWRHEERDKLNKRRLKFLYASHKYSPLSPHHPAA